eukprot:TRINITY_DN62806_c0_g3_i1.p1 TRINITY_DN62806_c0_g3~~TRINITY_DN62806_c0_g3_i1.p1  ORF type:complete len:522 (+),score=51.38 TRINITY_DN62806_c0_g3_i1:60-1625(+)
MNTVLLIVSAFFFSTCNADVYLHMFRGSNNRLNGQGVNAGNQNRLFNSQNNAKGGYNVGEGGTEEFYVGSEILLEWTAQHGCANPNMECQMILQYMCLDGNPNLRDGTTETTPPDSGNGGENSGQHEPYEYYKNCKTRQRNEGLFTADRRRFYSGRFYHAQYTRQNDNGNRRGYECQEERDYYPYWHPTPWRDIAVLVDKRFEDVYCPYYESVTENVVGRGYCTKPQHNNKEACEEGRFYYPQDEAQLRKWRQLERAKADCAYYQKMVDAGQKDKENTLKSKERERDSLEKYIQQEKTKRTGVWAISAPHDPNGRHKLRCRGNDFSRDNHLGNGESGQPVSFLWKIPDTPSDKCVFRLRYNMSSGDYPSWRTWSEHNGKKSPIFQNMKVSVGLTGKVELAINTNQIGRTFQDRSHVFKIIKRPSNIPPSGRIVNLNVCGKRGNIVQAYPAVEYDYHPNRLTICAGDWVHFQWTGGLADNKIMQRFSDLQTNLYTCMVMWDELAHHPTSSAGVTPHQFLASP